MLESKNAIAPENQGENTERVPYICDLSGLTDIISQLSKSQREQLISGYDLKELAKIFEDGEMMRTAFRFLKCGMNVSETARTLYMHRNTLNYRLNSIRRHTGLDLKDFDMAVTFKILHILYCMK